MECMGNSKQDRLKLVENLITADMEDLNLVRLQPALLLQGTETLRWLLRALARVVYLDHEAVLRAPEAEDKAADRVLAPKLSATDLPTTEGLPEQGLCGCGGLAERLCAGEGLRGGPGEPGRATDIHGGGFLSPV